MVEKRPLILTAKEKVDRYPNSRLNTYGGREHVTIMLTGKSINSYGLVTKLFGKLSISIVHVTKVDSLPSAIWAVDFDGPNTALAQVGVEFGLQGRHFVVVHKVEEVWKKEGKVVMEL